MRGPRILGGLAAVLCLAAPAARADIFMYTDNKGTIHFSNTPVDGRYKLYRQESAPPAAPAPTDAAPPLVSAPKEQRYDREILHYSSRYTLDPSFVKAVMKVESDFNPRAVSVAGAMGLMQLMPETAERLGVANPYDPKDNINGGVKYLSDLLRQFGTLPLAAAAYNSGESAVTRYGGVPPFNETKNYVKNVIRYYEVYRNAGDPGKGSAPATPPVERRDKIYAIKRGDGVIIYTNIPWAYKEKPQI